MSYWALLAPLIGVVCVRRSANDKDARLPLIWTQALHWIAFLVVMSILMMPSVQRILSTSATGLAILTTAGMYVLSWQVCLPGVVMALAVPAIAWIENSL